MPFFSWLKLMEYSLIFERVNTRRRTTVIHLMHCGIYNSHDHYYEIVNIVYTACVYEIVVFLIQLVYCYFSGCKFDRCFLIYFYVLDKGTQFSPYAAIFL